MARVWAREFASAHSKHLLFLPTKLRVLNVHSSQVHENSENGKVKIDYKCIGKGAATSPAFGYKLAQSWKHYVSNICRS